MKPLFIKTSAVLFSICAAGAFGASTGVSDAPKIRSAYQSEQGALIIRFEDNARFFPAGNTVFFKKGGSLQQIELSVSSDDDGSQDVSFSNGSVSFSGNQAALYCHGIGTDLRALTEAEMALLASDLRSKKLNLKFLPEVHEPAYLLQVKGSNELVYVTSPRYNFHGNYRVWLMHGNRRTKVETIETALRESSDLAGMVRFKNGGGLYVPGTIDLFLPPAKHRGSPSLIRAKGGKLEALVRPNLTRKQLLELGIKSPRSEMPISPCND